MMRVITGSARGRRLATLSGAEIVRPTSESVKEALFSIIQFEIHGKRVLDLFAGCGQLGIEALSRGAEHCTFVEKDKNAYAVVKENVQHCGFDEKATILSTDALSFLRGTSSFDIALLDPPYNKELISKALPLLVEHMSDNGVIVCESEKFEELPESAGNWRVSKIYNYGKTKLTLYRKVTE